MAIEEKAVFLKDLEQRLLTKITAADLEKVLAEVSDQLAGYDVIRTRTEYGDTDDFLEAYVEAITIQGRSEKTAKRYQYLIRKMMEYVNVPIRHVTVYHLRQYMMKEKERGISDGTLEGMRQVFNAYFNWLQREKLIDSNPMANFGTIKCQKKIKDTYTEVDIEKMKFSCGNIRDRAIVSFLMSTGCRISEALQLNRSDVDLDKLECTVLGKGNKERTVFLDAVTGMLLRDYLDQRMDESPALFIGKRKDRLTSQGVRAMLTKLAKASTVDHVHPHKFRRTLATNLIKHGMPIQEVASILGHEKLDTTMKYVVLDKTNVKYSYNKYA